ncbi:hypothetical protein HID58_020037, partial [Brassica napus]
TPRIQRPRREFDCVISFPPFLISSSFTSILRRPLSEMYLTMTKSKKKGKISEQPTPPENDVGGTLQSDLRLPIWDCGDVSSYETSSDNNGGGYCKDGRREGEGYKSGGHGRGGSG